MNVKYTLYECLANADMTEFKYVGKIAYRILASDLDLVHGGSRYIPQRIIDEYNQELKQKNITDFAERHALQKKYVEKVEKIRNNAKRHLDKYCTNSPWAYVVEYVHVDDGANNRSIPTNAIICNAHISGMRRDIKNGAVSNFDIKMVNQAIQITR